MPNIKPLKQKKIERKLKKKQKKKRSHLMKKQVPFRANDLHQLHVRCAQEDAVKCDAHCGVDGGHVKVAQFGIQRGEGIRDGLQLRFRWIRWSIPPFDNLPRFLLSMWDLCTKKAGTNIILHTTKNSPWSTSHHWVSERNTPCKARRDPSNCRTGVPAVSFSLPLPLHTCIDH